VSAARGMPSADQHWPETADTRQATCPELMYNQSAISTAVGCGEGCGDPHSWLQPGIAQDKQ